MLCGDSQATTAVTEEASPRWLRRGLCLQTWEEAQVKSSEYSRYCPTSSSFPWSHSMGVEKMLPPGRHSRTAELKSFFVLFKTNKWLHPSVYRADRNCNPLWFEFKPKSLHCLVSKVRKLSKNPSPDL